MGMTCLTVCPECNRHLRCGERACPFCGAQVSSFLQVLEYRVKTRLNRSQVLSLGASLTLAGFATSCVGGSVAEYGAPCNPPSCTFPYTGGNAGSTAGGGSSGSGGAGGRATGGDGDGGQMTSSAGAAGEGSGQMTSSAGAAGEGGGADEVGGAGGARSDENAGAGGDGGAAGGR
jgi:hypothetical protein